MIGGFSRATDESEAIGNRVTIENAHFSNPAEVHFLIGGTALADKTVNVQNNTVVVNGGLFDSSYLTNIAGGLSTILEANGYSIANGNRVEINGGQFNGPTSIYGGIAEILMGDGTHEVTHNTVSISGSPQFNGVTNLYGGETFTMGAVPAAFDVFTGNTLEYRTHGLTFNDVKNFENYDFYVPAAVVNGDTLLSATGTVDVDNSNVEVKGIESGSPLAAGEVITLIDANMLNGTAITVDSSVMQGVSLIYDVDVEQVGNKITATILSIQDNSTGGSGNGGNGQAARVNPQLKSLSEGRLASLAFIAQGGNIVADHGVRAAVSSVEQNEGMLTAFGTVVGSTDRYDSGSHVNVDGASIMVGAAYRNDALVIAGFAEGGRGSYDSYNSFNNAASVHGSGDTQYYGVGVLGHYGLENGVYLDGSVRIGRTDTDFKSHDLVSATGIHGTYDSKSTYYGAHVGVGYAWDLNDKNRADVSARYIWTHQGGDAVSVAGDPIDFASADSHRVRVNGRIFHNVNPRVTLMAGLGYEYEFDGGIDATTYRVYSIDSPSLKGGSGIGELGVRFMPSASRNLSIEAKVTGYVGQREGISGLLQMRYAF